jgi:hypothetical protein
MNMDERPVPAMRQTLQFLGLMACGLLAAGFVTFAITAVGGNPSVSLPSSGARSAAGVDYVSFGFGLGAGLIMAELARLSWSDLPRRVITWVIAHKRNARYFAYACVWAAVLILV